MIYNMLKLFTVHNQFWHIWFISYQIKNFIHSMYLLRYVLLYSLFRDVWIVGSDYKCNWNFTGNFIDLPITISTKGEK